MSRPTTSRPTMSSHDTARRTHAGARGWLQFSLRTALWMMVVLAVAFGWLADRSKLQQRLAEERAEKEALRAARDYGEPSFDLWGQPGYILSSTGSTFLPMAAGGEADEATVEHLKDFVVGEPTYPANLGGGYPWILGSGRVSDPFSSSSILLADSAILVGSNYGTSSAARQVNIVQDVAPKDAGSIAALIKRLADDDAIMRARAACTLARLGANAKDAVPALVERVNDGDPTVRFHAVYALGRTRQNSPEVALALRAAMEDDAGPAAPLAAQMLHRLDPSIDIVPRLIELLDDGDAETRRRAVTALLSVQGQPTSLGDDAAGPARAVPQLKRLLADPDPQTRKAAMTAVARLAPLVNAHAMLRNVVKRGPGTDRETWTFASLLWNKLDRQMRPVQSSEEPSDP